MKKTLLTTHYSLPPNRGFTLLELIVSIGIFSIALIIMVGVYSRFIAIERRDIGEQVLQEELRVALELLDREARTAFASTYALADDTGQSLTMRNQNGDCVNYRLNGNTKQIERAESNNISDDFCPLADFASSAYAPLTSPAVIIERLQFVVLLPTDVCCTEKDELKRQGFITVRVKAVTRNNLTAPLELQTSVTSRQVIPYQEVTSNE